MSRYVPDSIRELLVAIATKCGVSAPDALILADALVDSDLHGMSTHGVSRMNIYMRRIHQGIINAGVKLTVDRGRGSVISVDAGNGLGQVQAVKTLDLLLPSAKSNGIAAATVRNSQHFGALSYYCNR